MLNLLASAVYVVVAGLCALAARRVAAERRHWLVMAAGFLVLVAIRAANTEERVRSAARSWIGEAGLYGNRGEFQSLAMAALTILLGLALLLGMWAWSRRHSVIRAHWAVIGSRIALLGYVPLYAMRLISFHFTDRLLYGGPVHMNWLIDLGLAATVAACAVAAVKQIGPARPKSLRRGTPHG